MDVVVLVIRAIYGHIIELSMDIMRPVRSESMVSACLSSRVNFNAVLMIGLKIVQTINLSDQIWFGWLKFTGKCLMTGHCHNAATCL